MIRKKITILALALFLALAPAAVSFGAGCTVNANSDTLCNPLSTTDPQQIIINVVKILLSLIGVVAVVMIVIAGFRMVISGGNTEQVEKARSTLTWAVGGFALALLAYSIIAIVQNVISH